MPLPVPLLQFTASSLFNVQIKTWIFKIKNTFEDVCIEMYMRMRTRKHARLGSCVLRKSEGTVANQKVGLKELEGKNKSPKFPISW